MGNKELLPCPFCGGEAHVFHVGDWWVEHPCKKLGKYIGTRFCETEEEAAAWWNIRAERTCKIVKSEFDGQMYVYRHEFSCECGQRNLFTSDSRPPKHCPNCGAKVVEE